MRPSKIASVRWQASGRERVAGAGHAHQRRRHRVDHAAAMGVGQRHPVGLGMVGGSATYSLTVAPFITMRTSSYFLSVWMLEE